MSLAFCQAIFPSASIDLDGTSCRLPSVIDSGTKINAYDARDATVGLCVAAINSENLQLKSTQQAEPYPYLIQL